MAPQTITVTVDVLDRPWLPLVMRILIGLVRLGLVGEDRAARVLAATCYRIEARIV